MATISAEVDQATSSDLQERGNLLLALRDFVLAAESLKVPPRSLLSDDKSEGWKAIRLLHKQAREARMTLVPTALFLSKEELDKRPPVTQDNCEHPAHKYFPEGKKVICPDCGMKDPYYTADRISTSYK